MIEIPDKVAQQLGGEAEPLKRKLLEVLIADAYRCGSLSAAEVGQALNFSSPMETYSFLQQMGVYLNYDEEELEQDIETIKQFRVWKLLFLSSKTK